MLGSLTCDLTKRPFVLVDDVKQASLFPVPLTVIERRFLDGRTCSASALRLFYALLFTAWNVLDVSCQTKPIAYSSAEMRRWMSRTSTPASNANLREALDVLVRCRFEIAPVDDPEGPPEPVSLLDWFYIDGDGWLFFAFSEPVRSWCERTGATYAWLDLRVVKALGSIAAIRLYEVGAALARRDHKRTTVLRSELKVRLGAAETYAAWSDFEKKLLARSIAELNDRAPFKLNHEPRRVARHRIVTWEIISVTPTEPRAAAATPMLQPLQLADLALLPVPDPDLFRDFIDGTPVGEEDLHLGA